MQLTLRSLSFRTLIGLGAGVATMGLVLASALTAPVPKGTMATSTCPSKAGHSERSHPDTRRAEAGSVGAPHAPVAMEAAP